MSKWLCPYCNEELPDGSVKFRYSFEDGFLPRCAAGHMLWDIRVTGLFMKSYGNWTPRVTGFLWGTIAIILPALIGTYVILSFVVKLGVAERLGSSSQPVLLVMVILLSLLLVVINWRREVSRESDHRAEDSPVRIRLRDVRRTWGRAKICGAISSVAIALITVAVYEWRNSEADSKRVAMRSSALALLASEQSRVARMTTDERAAYSKSITYTAREARGDNGASVATWPDHPRLVALPWVFCALSESYQLAFKILNTKVQDSCRNMQSKWEEFYPIDQKERKRFALTITDGGESAHLRCGPAGGFGGTPLKHVQVHLLDLELSRVVVRWEEQEPCGIAGWDISSSLQEALDKRFRLPTKFDLREQSRSGQ